MCLPSLGEERWAGPRRELKGKGCILSYVLHSMLHRTPALDAVTATVYVPRAASLGVRAFPGGYNYTVLLGHAMAAGIQNGELKSFRAEVKQP